MLFLSETNTRQNTRIIEKMEITFSPVALNAKVIGSTTNININPGFSYLLGGIICAIWVIIQNLQVPDSAFNDDYDYYISFELKGKSKPLLVITMYRIPKTYSEGLFTAKHQCNYKLDLRKIEKYYRTRILDKIIEYIHNQKEILDIILSGNINSKLSDDEI